MSKKRIAAVHMALIGSQGVHVGSQGNPRDGQGMMFGEGKFKEGNTYGKRKKV